MTVDTVVGIVRLALGLCVSASGEGVVAAVVGGVSIVLGFVAAARCSVRTSIAIAITIAAPVIGHGILGARAIDNPIVITRYAAGVLPLVLALAGFGLLSALRGLVSVARTIFGRTTRIANETPSVSRIAFERRVALWGALFVVAALVVFGPLPRSLSPRASFGLRASCLVNVGVLGDRIDAARAPLWYGSSDARSAPLILEWPAAPAPRHLYALYQTMHGRPVVSVHPADAPGRGARFRSFVFGLGEAVLRIREDGGRLVVHRDPPHERLHVAAIAIEGEGRGQGRRPPRLERVLAEAERALGPPLFEDDRIAVFGSSAAED